MRNDIINKLPEILSMPGDAFEEEFTQAAYSMTRKVFGNKAVLTGILALSNYCINDCTYCGLRSESNVNRFRLSLPQLKTGVDYLESQGIDRIFLISGEDPLFGKGDIVKIIEYAAHKGFYITVGIGVYPAPDVNDFYKAGAREFCLKFETSNRNIFRKVKPSTDYDIRIHCLNDAMNAGFDIATGSIVGLADQSMEDIINDIKYTLTFNPSWIPLVPYLPAPCTPMAELTGPGDIDLTLRIISIFRLLLPECRITAGQPKKGSTLGFADPDGNAAAVKAGANSFFIDATPAAVREDFSIVGGRALAAIENIREIFRANGLEL